MNRTMQHTDWKTITIYFLMAVMVFFASFRAPNAEAEALSYSVPGYIGMLQNLSLLIVMVCAMIALFLTFVYRKTGHTARPNLLIYYYVFHLVVLACDLANSGTLEDFLTRVVFATVVFLFFYYVVSPLPFYAADRYHVLNAYFLGSLLFLLLNLGLHLTGVASLIWKGRFFGLTTHPNFIGLCGAVTAALSFALFYGEKSGIGRVLYVIGLLAGLWVCILSGSRTSLLGSAASIVTVLFFSVKDYSLKPLLILLILLGSILAISYVDLQSLDYANRGNTREETWASMYQEASQLPFFGRGRSGATTNAYLFAVVAGGVFGAFFFFRTIFSAIGAFFSRNLGTHYSAVIRCSIVALILVTSMLEGYLLDAAGIPVFTYWMILCYLK